MTGNFFYSLSFPADTQLRPSTLVERIIRGGRPFRLVLQKEGAAPLQIAVVSPHEIERLIRFAVADREYNCSVTGLDVLKSSGYSVSLSLRNVEGAVSHGLSEAVSSALLSLGGNERFRIILDVEPARNPRSAPLSSARAMIAFTLFFSGNEEQIANIFPDSAERGLWKMRPAWRCRPIFSFIPISTIDSLIPPFASLIEGDASVARRHPSFPEGKIMMPGLKSVSPSGTEELFLKEEDLSENFTVLGATGSGKSTLLSRLAAAFIERRRSVLIIDPHGDLVKKALSLVPQHAADGRIIYLDAIRSPVGLNPFEIFRSIAYRDQLSSLVTESIGHVVRSAYGQEYWGPRLDFLLKGLLDAVAPLKGTNYADVLELIDNPFAAGEIAESCSDAATREFLLRTLPRARDEWWMSVRDKLGRMILDTESRRILCQRRNNINLGESMAEGKSLFVDIDMSRIGSTTSSLLGSMILAMYWVTACSQRCGGTIIIDEAQLFPPRLIEEMASQGRKFGVNILIAGQSPSYFSREFLGAMGSNFRNRISMQLGEADSRLAAVLLGGVDAREIAGLDRMSALASLSGHLALLDIEHVTEDSLSYEDAVRYTARTYTSDDDALPSPLASMKGRLFDILQIADMAETLGKQSLSGLQETGIFQFFPYGMKEISALLEDARSLGLIQKAHLKLSQKGWNELHRLQGGVLAGGSEHRTMVIRVKKALDSMGMLTFIPRQRLGLEQPDLIARAAGDPSVLYYFEIEIATRYRLEERRKKMERAVRKGAIAVFVFNETGPPLSAVRKGAFPEALFAYMSGSYLHIWADGRWKTAERQEDLPGQYAKQGSADI